MPRNEMIKHESVADFLKAQEPAKRKILTQVRNIIKANAPDAEEGIGYGMPAYKLDGVLVYFGAFAKHYSLFATPSANVVFKDKLKPYKISKGTIQFSWEDPVPEKLIAEIVKFRVKENREKALAKKKR